MTERNSAEMEETRQSADSGVNGQLGAIVLSTVILASLRGRECALMKKTMAISYSPVLDHLSKNGRVLILARKLISNGRTGPHAVVHVAEEHPLDSYNQMRAAFSPLDAT